MIEYWVTLYCKGRIVASPSEPRGNVREGRAAGERRGAYDPSTVTHRGSEIKPYGIILGSTETPFLTWGLDTRERAILESHPLLEAFGNAKVGVNNHSSRFGKLVNLYFDNHGLVAGGRIDTFMLETSRFAALADLQHDVTLSR
jgi:hypothetical protein